MTDIDQIMSYTRYELEAVQKGLAYKNADEQERLAVLALNVRTAMNKKKLKATDLFNRRKVERSIEVAFVRNRKENKPSTGFGDLIQKANNIFNKD
ncbi:hypothetical protein [Aerococcus viridans]|nr:hypothetical protein [Aerococcus viridans]